MLAAKLEPLHTTDLRLYPAPQTPRPNTPLRIACLLAALPIGAVLAIGSSLNPTGGPLAIRRELGTARCGFYTKFGFPCPTCGWTTAVSHLYHGQIFSALITQPAGALFGALLVILFSLLIAGAWTGRWLGPSPLALWSRRWLIAALAAVVLLAAWGYKIEMVRLWPASMG